MLVRVYVCLYLKLYLFVWVLGMLLWIVEAKPECGSFSEKTLPPTPTLATKAEP